MSRPKMKENNQVNQNRSVRQDRKILNDFVDENTNSMQSPSSQKSYTFIHNQGQQESSMHQKQQLKLPLQDSGQYFQSMKKKLQTVFKFYASFGDRINVNYLKSNKLHKMLLDAGLKKVDGFDGKQIDILYSKINRNRTNMDFDSFLQMLHKISQIIFPACQLEDGLTKLLELHFQPLYDNILTQTDLGDEETKFQEVIEQPCFNAILYLQTTLTKIFQAYFPLPHKQFKLKDQQDSVRQRSSSESQLFLFLKDFDICPTFITKSSAYLLLDYILTQDDDKTFNFNKFCLYLCKVSLICYNNYHNEDITQIQKLAFVLERMELSPGFNTLESKIQLQINARLKLDADVIHQLQFGQVVTPTVCKINQTQDENSYDNSKRMGTAGSQDTKSTRSISTVSRMPTHESIKIIESCKTSLLQIYKSYCGINQATGLENQMSGAKWHKILKDANLIQNNDSLHNLCRLPYSEIDLMYSKACQKSDQRSRSLSTQGKQPSRQMNFQQFLEAISLLSQKLYSNIEQTEALRYILKENLLPLGLGISDNDSQMKIKLTLLMNLLKDPQVVELLSLLHKSLLIYYKYYSNAKGLISFDKFLRFYKEFDIFPDLIPKSKIINIFQTLSRLYEQNNQKRDLQEIDQHMFIESLALAALEVPVNEDVGNLERICFLIERMNQSEGPQIVQRNIGHTYRPNSQTWDILCTIKKQFPWIFASQVHQDKNLF